MIGDFILAIRKFWRQNVVCVHDYKLKFFNCVGRTWFRLECDKCGKVKKV